MVIDRRLPCRRRLPPTAKICVQQPQSTLLVCALDGRIDNGRATARTGPVRYYATASSIRQAARQIPDLSRIIRVRSSLTDGSRLRGALSIADIGACTTYVLRARGCGLYKGLTQDLGGAAFSSPPQQVQEPSRWHGIFSA